MCKFTNRIFVFATLSIVGCGIFVEPTAIRTKIRQDDEILGGLLNFLSPNNDYDLHYDQRQKGEENLRIKLDGFFVGLPASETSEVAMNDELLELLGEALFLGLGKSRLTTTTIPDLYSYDRVNYFQQKASNEAEKPEKIIVEIPAPKKVESLAQRLESKASEDRKPIRSISKIGDFLGMLLKLRALSDKKQKF